MTWNEYTLHELDLKFVFLIRDELKKILGNQADEAIMKSGFLKRLQEDPVYVHHFDEEYWVGYIVDRYNFLTAG